MILAGVDDAGRGSVIGPLVIAGVALDESKIPKLQELGVKDSKMLAPARRKILYRQIRKLAEKVVYKRIQPDAIDKVVLSGQKLFRLNYLEAKTMARVLLKLRYDLAFVDCCDTNQKRFGVQISDLMTRIKGIQIGLGEINPFLEKLHSEHHADRNHLVVSAASIVAKVTRDACIERLSKTYGNIGSGYPSDPVTISYLQKSYETSSTFPPITRESWLTIKRMRRENTVPETGIDKIRP